MGVLGLLAAVVILIVLIYKGINSIPASILAGLIVIVTNRMDIWGSLTEGYGVAMKDFTGSYLIMFILAAMFGVLMSESGAAFRIAYYLMKKIGKERIMLIIFITGLVLTYGGISTYLVAFTLYPIALVLFREADIPKRLFPAAVLATAATITMTMIPGTPSVQNVMPTTYFGTTIYAAPIIGIVCSVFTFVANYMYMTYEQKKAAQRGEHFQADPTDKIIDLTEENINNLPGIVQSLAPIVVLLVVIFALKGKVDSIFSVIIGMTASMIVGGILFSKKANMVTVFNDGAKNGVISVVTTASVVGFGGIVKMSPAFSVFVDGLMSLTFSPIIAAVIAINVISGITGSASGGLGIFLNTLGQHYAAMGLNPEFLHRTVCIASGGLDAMPYSTGAVVTTSVCKEEVRHTYKPIFVTCVIVPLMALVIAIILGSIGIV